MKSVYLGYGKKLSLYVVLGLCLYSGMYTSHLSFGFSSKKPQQIPQIGQMAIVLGASTSSATLKTVTPTLSPVIAVVTKSASPSAVFEPKKYIIAGLPFITRYTVLIPQSWNNTNKQDEQSISDDLTISKNGYELVISQKNTNSLSCIYTKENYVLGPSVSYKSFSTIESTEAEGYTYRRSENEAEEVKGRKSFTICEQYNAGYVQPTTFGIITYKVPEKCNPLILQEMDAMVASLRKK
jgi:hypothetical protein